MKYYTRDAVHVQLHDTHDMYTKWFKKFCSCKSL